MMFSINIKEKIQVKVVNKIVENVLNFIDFDQKIAKGEIRPIEIIINIGYINN